ncbi:MAG: hypothetical protein ACRDT6_26950 [Micromonosporaceae bacterium]
MKTRIPTAYPCPGLQPPPLGGYLAALGMLRIASQYDPDAALAWRYDGVPIIEVGHRRVDFEGFAATYVPTPVVTPWQSGGGWGPKDKTPTRRLQLIRTSDEPRLAPLRAAIAAADKASTDGGGDAAATARILRNSGPDDLLPWIDACRGTGPDSQLLYSPLVATGNDGRWDISTNYHAAVLAVLADAERAQHWATDLLNAEETEPLLEMSLGPYWPHYTQAGLANPWQMILTVEGICVWGSCRNRLLTFIRPGTPWMTPQGYPIDHEPGRGEVFTPLWQQALTLREVEAMFGEGYCQWRGKPAGRPVQMISAFNAGGFPSAITRLDRYGILRRHGRNCGRSRNSDLTHFS